jgi:hypothetical protein
VKKTFASFGAVSSLTVALVMVAAVPSSYAEEELPVLGSASATDSELGESTVDVNSLEVSEDGTYAMLTYTVHSEGASIGQDDFRNSTYLYTGFGFTGVTMVDEDAGLRYNTALDSTGQCLCAVSTASRRIMREIDSGGSATYWASYLISEETTSVSVEVPGFEPVTDIAVE